MNIKVEHPEKETWHPIPKLTGEYEVSSFGNVRSLDRVVLCINGQIKHLMGRVLKRMVNPQNGYPYVVIKSRGSSEKRYVHELVLTTFEGPRPEGGEARHFPDRTKTNCRRSNLRWGTRKENHQDKKTHGTDLFGERHPSSKLTLKLARKAVDMLKEGKGPKEIGEALNVSPQCICDISKGRRWKRALEDT